MREEDEREELVEKGGEGKSWGDIKESRENLERENNREEMRIIFNLFNHSLKNKSHTQSYLKDRQLNTNSKQE